jgi:hypothetical protein
MSQLYTIFWPDYSNNAEELAFQIIKLKFLGQEEFETSNTIGLDYLFSRGYIVASDWRPFGPNQQQRYKATTQFWDKVFRYLGETLREVYKDQ